MSYLLYKLRFPNGIHVGTASGNTLEETMMSVYSDTFYSAIFNEYMKIYNDDELYKISEAGEFLVSDLLPFKEKKDMSTDFYLPKPFISVQRQEMGKNEEEEVVDRKKVKATNFIPADKLGKYLTFLKTGKNFPEIDDDFGKKELYTKNKVSLQNEDTKLYNIEVFKFNEKSGLYFIVKLPENNEWQEIFENILESLSLTGIGGKRNSGFGQFISEDPMFFDGEDFDAIESESDAYINKALYSDEEKYLSLSSYSPKIEEIEKIKESENYYQLIKRSGFVNSSLYSEQAEKRKQVYMLSSGSVLSFKPEGKILDLNLHGKHSIYRMGKPIVLGVKI